MAGKGEGEGEGGGAEKGESEGGKREGAQLGAEEAVMIRRYGEDTAEVCNKGKDGIERRRSGRAV